MLSRCNTTVYCIVIECVKDCHINVRGTRNMLECFGKYAWIMHNTATLIMCVVCVLMAMVVLGAWSEAPYRWSTRPTGK